MLIQIRIPISVSLTHPPTDKRGANLYVDLMCSQLKFSVEIQKNLTSIVRSFDHRQLPQSSYEDFASALFKELLESYPDLGAMTVDVDSLIKYRLAR